MHNRSDSAVFVLPNGVEQYVVVCGECDASICDSAVDVCYLKGLIESMIGNKAILLDDVI
jgi:hypothetical protein